MGSSSSFRCLHGPRIERGLSWRTTSTICGPASVAWLRRSFRTSCRVYSSSSFSLCAALTEGESRGNTSGEYTGAPETTPLHSVPRRCEGDDSRPGNDIRAKHAAARRKEAPSAAITQHPPTDAVSKPAVVGPRICVAFLRVAGREPACWMPRPAVSPFATTPRGAGLVAPTSSSRPARSGPGWRGTAPPAEQKHRKQRSDLQDTEGQGHRRHDAATIEIDWPPRNYVKAGERSGCPGTGPVRETDGASLPVGSPSWLSGASVAGTSGHRSTARGKSQVVCAERRPAAKPAHQLASDPPRPTLRREAL